MNEQADWGANFAGSSMAAYEDALVQPLFVPWAEHLLDAMAVGPGEAVLDVACGPGTVARLAAERVGPSGSVVGCDLSPEMLSIAEAKAGAGLAVEYRQCPADALAVEADAFDAALCQQGLQFFGDRGAALGELRRALVDGGRVGISVWCDLDSCEPFAALAAAIGEVLGADTAAAYGAGPWGYPDPDDLRAGLEAAGFADVEVRREEITVAFTDAGHLIRTLGAAPIAPLVDGLDADGRRRLHDAVVQATAPLVDGGSIRGVTAANTATGRA